METASFVGLVRIILVIGIIIYVVRLLNKVSVSRKQQEQQREMDRMREELQRSKEREGKITIDKNQGSKEQFSDFEELD